MTKLMSCALLTLVATASADTPKKPDTTKTTDTTKKAPKQEAVFISAADVKWGPAPPDLPKGAQLAVLSGDPTKPVAFTMRVKLPDGYKIPPHYHTKDESLTIIGGTLNLMMGDNMTNPHALDVGAFHFLPGKMHHGAEAKGETIVQIHGTGPFDIIYLNPADNPNPKAASR